MGISGIYIAPNIVTDKGNVIPVVPLLSVENGDRVYAAFDDEREEFIVIAKRVESEARA